MTYIDFYLVKPVGTHDFNKALSLIDPTDDDAEGYVSKLREVIEDGYLDRDDLTEKTSVNGQDVWVFQDHNGQGDGGCWAIANTDWFARTYPDAYAAMGVEISWGKGTAALMGNPARTV